MITVHTDLQKSEVSGESVVIYSFYMYFSFLALVRVYIFLESVSVKAVIAHTFSTRSEKLVRNRELA